VKVIKSGRAVSAYQLVNFAEFNNDGRYVGKPKVATKTAQVNSDAAQVKVEVSSEVV
jgi:hypothetical protein